MKKQLNLHKPVLTLALLLCTAWSFANGDDGEKKKTISKSYPVSATDKITISNQFGEVKIVTWDKSEAKAEITVTTHASSDEKAQSILDGITIEDGKNGDGVYFKTNMPGNHEHNNDGGKDKDKDKDKDKEKDKGDKKNHDEGMQVNYVVYMPGGNPLKLENQFGKSIVPDLGGPVEITEKFGDLVAGKLSNVKELRVEFGKATVESITNGKVLVKFSEASVKKMVGAIKASFEFSGKIKLPLDNDVTDFSLNNSYSSIEVAVSSNFSGDFEIHTNFGDFKNSTALPIKEEKDEDDHGPKFDKDYSGKSGSGACKVKMKSSFGSIKFM